jgi:hypothetical protein
MIRNQPLKKKQKKKCQRHVIKERLITHTHTHTRTVVGDTHTHTHIHTHTHSHTHTLTHSHTHHIRESAAGSR